MVVQINGKTRDVVNIKKDLIESDVHKLVNTYPKVKKHLLNKTIVKTIFIKNKIINYIAN